MNNIKINVTVNSLANLKNISPGIYEITMNFLDSLGAPILSFFPASPWTTNVLASSTTFDINVPVTNQTFSFDDMQIEILGNGPTNECCKTVTNTDITNCNFQLSVLYVGCNGVAGLWMQDYNDPITFSVKILDEPEELFVSRSGTEIYFTPYFGASRTYEITATEGNGCVTKTTFVMTCLQPTFAYEHTQIPCDPEASEGVGMGEIRLFNVENATTYSICYHQSGPCFPTCSYRWGSINLSGDTIIYLLSGIPGSSTFVTIRLYNGVGCELYKDVTVESFTPNCAPLCPPDGTWSQNSAGNWYKKLSEVVGASPSGYAIVAKPNGFYAIDGTRVYSDDLLTFTALTTAVMWRATTGSNGPMNRAAIWTNQEDISFPINYLPQNSWIGFTHCLEGLTIGKKYYVGIEADNKFVLTVDDKVIMENHGTDTHFRTWKVIPVVATRTEMIISMRASNVERVAGFGCEIYDNTIGEIVSAAVPADLDIIFSSISKIGSFFDIGSLVGGIRYGYECPQGYTYNACTGDCEVITYCE